MSEQDARFTMGLTSLDFIVPKPGERWVHFKGGDYLVNHIGIDVDSGEPEVAYYPYSQDGDYRRDGPGAVTWFHRRLGDFLGSTATSSGAKVRRFVRHQK